MSSDTPIAVIGLSYRAPGVGRKGLWEYLAQARSAWTNVPDDRFDQSAYFRAAGDKSGVMRVRGAHFVDDVYGFDAAFFDMRAEEAKNSDPQHRMMLECAFEAAEDAGLSMPDLAGRRIGVFVGSGQHEYSQRLGDDEFSTHTFSGTGVAPCMAANRISYFFDIDGPSVVTDAACASSVYAAHVAVSTLRNHECEAAFVGSSSLNLGPGGWIVLEKTGALSDHGRSYSYGEKATGFGRGEGAACLLVKRLDDAIRDGDPIHALIRNSACNHGGQSEGITMPNGLAQQKLLWAVHKGAGLDPSDTPVVEGHGTGTAAGDPIEAGAFTAVLGRDRTAENPLYLGSIKSNFGHLEGASGILAMVKAIMMVEHGVVLPTAGFEKINPKIGGAEKIRIAETPLPWPKDEPRRAIVTNFGFGGSNSAIILEAAPDALPLDNNGATSANEVNGGTSNSFNGHGSNGTDYHHTNGTAGQTANETNGQDTNGSTKLDVASAKKKMVFAFSAKTEKSLTAYLASFDEYLDETPDTEEFAKDLSYTLGQRRTNHSYRAVVAAESIESLQEKLSAAKPTRIKDRTIAFAFTGQGAQHAQMASGLRRFKVFTEAIDEAENYLKEMGSSWSLSEELAKPAPESRVDAAEISQPACTCVQLALVALLKSWGIATSAVVGHSSGEIAAAFAAGLVSFKAAVAIAYFRGKFAAQLLRQQAIKGAMLALGVGEYEAGKLIDEYAGGYATVAAINSPKSVTISGDNSAIDNLLEAAEKQGIFARKLKVEMAYHSRHMEEVASSYLEAIKPYCDDDYSFVSKEGADTTIPTFISSVTGEVTDEVNASYWVKNLVRPVRFSDAIQRVFTSTPRGKVKSAQGVPNVVIEIGPHPALKNPIKQSVDALQLQGKSAFTYLPSLRRDASGADAMVDMACSLFTMGVPINIGGVNQTDKTNAKVVYEFPRTSGTSP